MKNQNFTKHVKECKEEKKKSLEGPMGYLHGCPLPPLATRLLNPVVETWRNKKVRWVVAKGTSVVVATVHGREAAITQKRGWRGTMSSTMEDGSGAVMLAVCLPVRMVFWSRRRRRERLKRGVVGLLGWGEKREREKEVHGKAKKAILVLILS